MQEQSLLQMVIQKESWEELINHIVTFENMDPWNIDIVKLTDSFLQYIQTQHYP